MAIANTPNQTREWVKPSERELPTEQRTFFKIRAVPFAVRSHFGVLLGMTQGGTDETDIVKRLPAGEMARLYVLALRTCLVGWRNFRDSSGSEVPFAATNIDVNGTIVRGAASDEALEMLDTETTAELGQECLLSMVLNKRDALG